MIKFNEVKAVKLVATNESDEQRVYDIKADVEFRDGQVRNIQEGVICRKGEEAGIANFSAWSETNRHFNTQNVPEEEHAAVYGAVNTFIKALRSTQQPAVAVEQ